MYGSKVTHDFFLSVSDTKTTTEEKPDDSHSKPDDSHSTADSGLDTSIITDTTSEESKFSEVIHNNYIATCVACRHRYDNRLIELSYL